MPSLKILTTGAAFTAALVLFPIAGIAGTAVPDTVTVVGFVVDQGDTLWVAPQLEIVGSRVPAALPVVVRDVEMLSGEELAAAPGRSAAEVLQQVPGVVTGQRQQYGVQSDLTIRGSTFEQVQVLLDGFDVSDPQTGHHVMDLPLGRHDIERLEVLKGQGSALYGSGAFGGVVNVVSRRANAAAGDYTGGEIAATGGGLGTWGTRASLEDATRDGDTGLRLSFERFHSDGQDVEQDGGDPLQNESDLWSAIARLDHAGDNGENSVFVGWSKRRFGALDFYAPYPSFERTETFFASARVNRSVSDRWTVEPRAYFRRHTDEFILIRDMPEVYANDHVTRRAGTELRAIGTLDDRHALAVGIEGVYEDLDSQGIRSGVEGPAMGNHLRRRLSVSAELDRHTGRMRWQLGSRLDARPDHAPRWSATSAVACGLAEHWTARASAGTMFRLPTWTELNYTSPVNLGLSTLQPEKGWAWDAGVDWRRGPWTAQAGYFERHEEDLIEWAMAPGDSVFQVMNIADGTVRGIETSFAWRHGRGHVLSAGWAWLDKESDLPAGYIGRYTLLAPRHVLTGRGTVVLPLRLSATLTARYIQRTGGLDAYRTACILDGRLDWNARGSYFASLAGTNLTDRDYEEVPGVPMPGVLATLTLGRRF